MSVGALKNHFSDIERVRANLQMDQIETPFSLDFFRFQPELQEWIHNPKLYLILVGGSGIGKTQFCKPFVKHNNLKTLLVSHKKRFKNLLLQRYYHRSR